jgi:hypothetical protein
MEAHMKPHRKKAQYREISEKEMNDITKAFGKQVRAQSVEVDRKIQENLQREFTAARSRAALMFKWKEAC